LVDALGGDLQRAANLHSVQRQGGLEALAHGVRVHEIGDFADCAAMMLAMDRIVTVDTAAVHLAGAIGHPRVELLLSHWASWRWLAPWYANVRFRRQTIADDWDSALAQLDGGIP
jgi:ADP-heptose:LPS heptosyltransferase